MKNYYFILFIITSFAVNGQGDCDYANSYLVSAYSHVKDSYDSNNINHLQYYANRSLESFKLAKKEFTNCNCKAALELTDKCIDLLAKVDTAETFENGRFFVKRARDYSKNSVIEIDKCSAAIPSNEDNGDLAVAQGQGGDDLTDLQNEQLRLKQQQEALKLKEQQIKMKLAEQKEKELLIKKKKLILSYENAISSNINTYNETLNICGCINYKPFRDNKSLEDMTEKNIEEVKIHYMIRIKTMASEYVSLINDCEE
ncbi:hypothetical protein Q4Q34_14000 [Flavivirga abyssicola]|uniref:hypothetical protein n=1 Tax=Flavivirga abyssicola TaxID=3063533 RepID=UPI0026DF0592|nr:hypothetical protein [Flavivirga sp. MEBiC07777]WVK12334.1 hypothetical protein Q4Q34_14000 [Flavivirga sp. MEBiC07777]